MTCPAVTAAPAPARYDVRSSLNCEFCAAPELHWSPRAVTSQADARLTGGHWRKRLQMIVAVDTFLAQSVGFSHGSFRLQSQPSRVAMLATAQGQSMP